MTVIRYVPTKRIKRISNEPVLTMSDTQADPHDNTKIAIIQTGSWGDNINSTLMLQPLKARYPQSRIEVHTSTYFGSAFANNPYIDKLIKHPSTDKNSSLHLAVILPPKLSGYDIVFNPHPMFNGDKWTSIKHPELGTNLILAWVRALEHNDIEYTLPLQTILQLTADEVRNVDAFCSKVDKFADSRNILMEVAGESGQSFWTPQWTVTVGKHLLNGNTNLFISRRDNGSDIASLQQYAPGRVYFVGGLTIRECAELYNRCHAFFSVSSGLSNACNTNWCRNNVTWVEVVNSLQCSSAPIRAEGKIYWHHNNVNEFIGMLQSRNI